MQKRLGDSDVKAQFGFVCIDPKHFFERTLYSVLRNICLWEKQRIEEGVITTFTAFVEAPKNGSPSQSRAVTRTFDIDGEIAIISRAAVEEVLRVKAFHASEAFRKSGNKSTHPPKFLTKTMLVLVIGSRRFLMDNLHLYLEDEGLLRPYTFELLKDVGDLEPSRGCADVDDYLHVDVAHAKFYRGNVEELGRIAQVRTSDESAVTVFSTEELLQKLND